MSTYATTRTGDRVAYDRRGQGPGLVFVSGAGPYRAIDPVTTRTAELAAEAGLTTVDYDRLGRGESLAEGRLDLRRELDAVAAMIEVAGGRATLCGHSSGCAIALAAVDADLPVDAVVLWEAPLGEPTDEVRTWIEEFERRLDAEDYVGATEHFMKDMPPEWLEGMRQDPDFEEIARGSRTQRADGQALVWASEAMDDGTLARLTVPVLATYGTTTFPGMREYAEQLAATMPHATAQAVPGADHSWDPGAMASRLVAFVLTEAPQRRIARA